MMVVVGSFFWSIQYHDCVNQFLCPTADESLFALKNVAAKQISPPPPQKKVANPVKRFGMHGLEVYSFSSVKYANPVFPLCCESFV